MKTNRFTLERSKEIIRKAKQAAIGAKEIFEKDIYEDIGYRNSPIQIPESLILDNIKKIQNRNEIHESLCIECPAGIHSSYNLTIEMETGTGKTYTYICTMYELHEKYGWSKYIFLILNFARHNSIRLIKILKSNVHNSQLYTIT